MTELDEGRLSRLPNYARVEIIRLRRSVEELEERLAQGPEGSDTFLANGYHEPRTPLGESPQVAFYLTRKGAAEDAVHERITAYTGYIYRGPTEEPKGYLEVVGGDSIVVKPWSGNVVRIWLERP